VAEMLWHNNILSEAQACNTLQAVMHGLLIHIGYQLCTWFLPECCCQYVLCPLLAGAATLQQGAGTAMRRSLRLLLSVGASAGSTVTALAGSTTTVASLVLATLTAMFQASYWASNVSTCQCKYGSVCNSCCGPPRYNTANTWVLSALSRQP
jgi:hypothetical protein